MWTLVTILRHKWSLGQGLSGSGVHSYQWGRVVLKIKPLEWPETVEVVSPEMLSACCFTTSFAISRWENCFDNIRACSLMFSTDFNRNFHETGFFLFSLSLSPSLPPSLSAPVCVCMFSDRVSLLLCGCVADTSAGIRSNASHPPRGILTPLSHQNIQRHRDLKRHFHSLKLEAKNLRESFYIPKFPQLCFHPGPQHLRKAPILWFG